MSYLVLARKYRPRNFSEMVGQEHVVQALVNALQSQRLHHAYLFTGTRGVGKTTVSRILAKSLNCQGPDGQGGITATPCGVCQPCREIDAGRFVDYIELDAASNRGVDEVQTLLEQAIYKPVQGRFKVFMIDEVHMLTNHAFNAMLKTLEEPPEYLKFVLATTDPQKVPVTVLSRCLQFNLRPMAPETVREHLAHVLQAEAVPADTQALWLLARAARGSMRDALSLTDQAIAYGQGALTEALVRQMLGSADRTQVFTLLDALARGDGRTVVDAVETLRRDGVSAASTLEEMTAVLQAMAVLQVAPPQAPADAVDPDAGEIVRLADAMARDETQLLYKLCLHGREELGLAPDEYAALTMVLLRLLAFKPADAPSRAATEKKTLNEALRPVGQDMAAVQPAPSAPETASSPESVPPWEDEAPVAQPPAPVAPSLGRRLPVVDRPVAVEAGPQATATAAGAAQQGRVVAVPVRITQEAAPGDEFPPQAKSAESLVLNEEGDFWCAVVARLMAEESVTALARELALQSQLVARDVDQWLLRVERESLTQAACRERLQAALAAHGHAVRLAVEIGSVSDSPARRSRAAAEARQQAAEEAIRNDPLVQSLMRDFGARIVPGSVRPA